MKQLKILLALSVGIGIFIGSGCRKDIPVEEQEVHKTMDNLVVSPSFNWETTREINVTISTTIPELITGTLSRIFIYLGNPTEGGKLVITGSVGYEYPLTAKLRLPTAATTLHLQLIAGSGYSEVVEVPILDDLTYTFTGKGGEKVSSGEITEPDCTIGCDWSLSGGGSNTINNGQTYCITDDYDGFISITNGTLRICGTFNGTISMGSGNNTCNLIVTSSGNATISSLSMTKKCMLKVFGSATASIGSFMMNQTAQLVNFGAITINSNFTSYDLVRNSGTLTINGQYDMNGNNVALENSGDLTINSNWNVINEVTNDGLIEVFGDVNFNSSEVKNYCKIISHQNVNFNNVEYISNNGYIKSVLRATINESSFLVLQNKSMISATEFIMYNTVTGQGSTNVIKCTSFGQIIGTRYVSGVVEMLTPDGTLMNGSYPANFENGATLLSLANASVYIPP
ncbi:MAG: hypothetical protein H8D88_00455, partial [Bacteroidetes bacterium]|nr:hypothetical protein [Bacteroidota bacterium]